MCWRLGERTQVSHLCPRNLRGLPSSLEQSHLSIPLRAIKSSDGHASLLISYQYNNSRFLAILNRPKLTALVLDTFHNVYGVSTAHYKASMALVLIDYGKTHSYIRAANPEFQETVNDHVVKQHDYHGWDGTSPYFEDQTGAALAKYGDPRDTSIL